MGTRVTWKDQVRISQDEEHLANIFLKPVTIEKFIKFKEMFGVIIFSKILGKY